MAKRTTYFTKEKLQELLEGKFGQNFKVLDFTSQPGTTAGDNYGSTLLALDVKVLNDNITVTHHIIAKLLPPTEFLCEIFNIDVTFCKELNFYKLVYPAYLELQKESGICDNEIANLIPSFLGGQAVFNDAGGNNDAVILLENLKVCNYECADRMKGLDLNHCELIMQKLAHFHALSVALREMKPEVYKNTVLKSSVEFRIGPKSADEIQDRKNFIADLIKNVPECRNYADQIEECILSHKNFENSSLAKEPFASLLHNDFWTNNILFKYEDTTKKLTDVKIVDFQITLCCSPVRDILFFLFTSAQSEVVEKHYDYLIDTYYESFISLLKKLKCDVKKFSKSYFLEEINTFAPTQLYHILFMLDVIYATKENTVELADLTSEDNLVGVGSSEMSRKKMVEAVNEFERRGWLREVSEQLL